jgi:prevent-host-death family protein
MVKDVVRAPPADVGPVFGLPLGKVRSVNVQEAKTHFSRLLARVEGGEEILIARAGTPVARVVPERRPAPVFGADHGKLVVPEDFDAPLPGDVLPAFEGRRS